MQAMLTMSTLTPNDYVLLGFVGFWGLVGVGIIAAAVYIWRKDRQSAAHQNFRPRRRRRV
jgi:hypothetical protein